MNRKIQIHNHYRKTGDKNAGGTVHWLIVTTPFALDRRRIRPMLAALPMLIFTSPFAPCRRRILPALAALALRECRQQCRSAQPIHCQSGMPLSVHRIAQNRLSRLAAVESHWQPLSRSAANHSRSAAMHSTAAQQCTAATLRINAQRRSAATLSA